MNIDLTQILTTLGYPAAMSIVLLWLMVTKLEGISEEIKELIKTTQELSKEITILSERIKEDK